MTSNAAQCSRIVGRKSGFTLAKNYGPRTWKALAVFVVAACVAIHGQSSPKQMADPAVAALGSGFVSDTAQVNGATLHYVRGGAGRAIILLHGFPEDWYAYHADALRAHGCASVEIEVIENSVHYVADEQPDAVAQLIEQQQLSFISNNFKMSSPMLWLNSSNGMPRYNDDYRLLCGGTRRTYVESQGGKGSVSRSTVLDDQGFGARY
jgi:hypothetical protein